MVLLHLITTTDTTLYSLFRHNAMGDSLLGTLPVSSGWNTIGTPGRTQSQRQPSPGLQQEVEEPPHRGSVRTRIPSSKPSSLLKLEIEIKTPFLSKISFSKEVPFSALVTSHHGQSTSPECLIAPAQHHPCFQASRALGVGNNFQHLICNHLLSLPSRYSRRPSLVPSHLSLMLLLRIRLHLSLLPQLFLPVCFVSSLGPVVVFFFLLVRPYVSPCLLFHRCSSTDPHPSATAKTGFAQVHHKEGRSVWAMPCDIVNKSLGRFLHNYQQVVSKSNHFRECFNLQQPRLETNVPKDLTTD
uniref:Uncharacterized protein n=1 Tax=Timema poppense TaxID=170557 RepID=A0A7R9CGU4_TIMPO|nr:unnamed protein product [Timema poppensis]